MISYLRNLWRRLLSEKFMRSGLILFLGSLVSNVASYFYQFVMSRLMPPKDFGTLNAVFSLFHLTTVAVSVVGLVVVKYVSDFQARGEYGKLRLFVLNSFRNLGSIGLLLGVLIYFARGWLGEFLKLESTAPLVLLAGMVFLGFVYPVGIGFLQGLQLFARFAWTLAFVGIVRLVSGVILVKAGFGVLGAIFSNILAFTATIFFSFKPLVKVLSFPERSKLEKHTKEILIFTVPATLAYLGCSGLLYLDLILVKHFFSPDMAGQYTAAVILGRSIFYFPMALSMAMYPMMSESHALQKDASRILVKCLLLTALLSAAGALAFMLFPDFWIRVLFGSQYAEATRLLPLYSLSMLPLSISNVLIQSRLAVKQFSFIPALLIALLLEFILIWTFHDTLNQVLLIINLLQWTAAFVLLFFSFRKTRTMNVNL